MTAIIPFNQVYTTETSNQSHQTPLPELLLQMITNTWVIRAIYVAAKLGIADLLKDGAKSSHELAKLTDANADALYRVLRALASVGIFAEGENQQFQLSPLAEYLQSDIPGSMRAFAIFLGEPWLFRVYEDVLYTIKTGNNAFENLYGIQFYPYLGQNPEKGQIADEAMTSLTSSLIPALLTSYDFSSSNKVVDIGGGQGILISEILKAYPHTTGVLFDQPFVIERAKHFIAVQGVAERCEFVVGNLFESVPTGCDTYIMKNIIHGPNVEAVQQILRNCYQAMSENSKLLILEKVVPPANQPSFSKWLDIQMLVAGYGRERTEIEYRELLAAAGFKLTQVVYTQSYVADVIEAVKI